MKLSSSAALDFHVKYDRTQSQIHSHDGELLSTIRLIV